MSDKRETIHARDEVSRKYGMIKVYLRLEEVALLSNGLAWMQADLSLANEQLKKLSANDIRNLKDKLPQGLFTRMNEVIKHTQESLLVQSIADFEESGDSKGKTKLKEELDEQSEYHGMVQKFMYLVLLSAQTLE